MSSEDKITKVKLPVEIVLDDGKIMTGFLFLGQTARLSDTMNDNRIFMPFETALGKFCTLKKAAIVSVTPLDQNREFYDGNDPYRILGVSENTSYVEIKQTYIRLCTEHHPDKIRGLGLADEYVELANLTLSRINEAFQRITKAQQEAQADAASGGASSATGG